jgi:hypothetical protein
MDGKVREILLVFLKSGSHKELTHSSKFAIDSSLTQFLLNRLNILAGLRPTKILMWELIKEEREY